MNQESGLDKGVFFLTGIIVLVLSGFNLICPPRVFSEMTPQEVALQNNLEKWNTPVFNMGVGLAYAADARGAQGGFTNPAALSRIQNNQFTIEYQRWGKDWDLLSAGIAHPTFGGSAYSLQMTWLDYGELEPDYDTQLYRPQGSEFKAGVTYSQLFFEQVAVGVTGNVMTSKIGFRERETGGSFDLGALVRFSPDFWFGAVGKNLNGSLEIADTKNKLPTQYRAGFAWYLYQQRIGITVDAVKLSTDQVDTGESEKSDFGMAGGIRYLFSPHLRFALGYHDIYLGQSGFTGNLGIKFPTFYWQLGYLQTEEENIMRTGGTMRF